MTSWTPQSWRGKPLKQVPDYPDQAALAMVEKQLAMYPPLVFAGEVRRLRDELGKASRGQSARGQLCCYVLVVLAIAVIGLGLYFTCTKSHFPPLGVCTQR